MADGDQPNLEGARMVDVSSSPAGALIRPERSGDAPSGPDDQPAEAEDRGPDRIVPPVGPPPQPFSIQGLLLLDSLGNDPVDIEAVTFDNDGIGVIRSRGERARVLPWSSVTSHAVEPWTGGVVPEWWVDPELNRKAAPEERVDSFTDPGATNRSPPHAEAGALIGIQTPAGTYRFLLPGGDARQLSRQVTAFAVRHHGPAGASSVTRVVAWGQDAERRRVKREPKREITWSKVQPYLVVTLILFLCGGVTLILLQSAGIIHLPYLGGAGSATVGSIRIR